MNTYQRQLLHQLINELTDNPDPSLHAAQMLAAELKGASHEDFPSHEDFQKMDMEQQTRLAAAATVKDFIDKTPVVKTTPQPTPDADGWVENTGVMPECRIVALKWSDGSIMDVANDKRWQWDMKSSIHSEKFAITHFKPA